MTTKAMIWFVKRPAERKKGRQFMMSESVVKVNKASVGEKGIAIFRGAHRLQ